MAAFCKAALIDKPGPTYSNYQRAAGGIGRLRRSLLVELHPTLAQHNTTSKSIKQWAAFIISVSELWLNKFNGVLHAVICERNKRVSVNAVPHAAKRESAWNDNGRFHRAGRNIFIIVGNAGAQHQLCDESLVNLLADSTASIVRHRAHTNLCVEFAPHFAPVRPEIIAEPSAVKDVDVRGRRNVLRFAIRRERHNAKLKFNPRNFHSVNLLAAVFLVKFGVVRFGEAANAGCHVAQKSVTGLPVALQFNVKHFGHAFGFSA